MSENLSGQVGKGMNKWNGNRMDGWVGIQRNG